MVVGPPAPGAPVVLRRRGGFARRRRRVQLPPDGPALAPRPPLRPRSVPAPGRRALRLPAMRGSIHLLPRATAHLAFRAVPEPPSSLRRRLKYFGIPEERYPELREAVLAAAAEPTTARDLGRMLGEKTGYDGSPTPVLGGMAREGVLLRVGAEGPRSNALRYVAAPLARRRPAPSRPRGGARLARRRVPARLRARQARGLPLVGRRHQGPRLGRARDGGDRRAGGRVPPAGGDREAFEGAEPPTPTP